MKEKFRLTPTRTQCLLIIPIVLFFSCTYKTDEVYIRKVQEVLPPAIEVMRLDLQEDTIVLHKNVNVSFEFKSSDQPVFQTVVSIDGKEQTIIQGDKGSFLLSFYALSDGMHDLQLDLYTRTGTGSIADKLDAEAFVTTQKWKVMVYKSFKTDVSTEVVNGFLKVKLSPYAAPDFKAYVVSINDFFAKTEKKLRINEFTDSSYFGQPRRFNFYVLTTDSLLIPWGTLGLTRDLPSSTLKQTGKHQYEYRFTAAKYYGGIDTFIIYQQKSIVSYDALYHTTNYKFVEVNPVKKTTDYRDTIFSYFDSTLCQSQFFHIQIVPKVNAQGWKKYGDYGNIHPEILTGSQFTFGLSYWIEPMNNDEFVYFSSYRDGVVCKYSIPNRKVVEQNAFFTEGCYPRNSVNISVSPSGEYATYFEPCNSSVKFINTNNFQHVTSYNLNTYFGEPRTYPAVPISDIATGIVNFSYGGFSLYDFASSRLIAKYREKSYVVMGLKISANGKYFWVKEDQELNLIQLEGNYFSSSIGSLKFSDAKYYDFDRSNPERLFLYKENTFSIKRCSDFSNLTSYALSDSMILSIDAHNNEMVTFNAGYLIVRSISDGKILHKLPCGFIPFPGKLFCQLRNHYLIFSQGVIYPLNSSS